MAKKIARRLNTTYLIIILATVVSGGWCLYVLDANLRSNTELRRVTLPSVKYLKDMRAGMDRMKRLSATWVYAGNNRDKERLQELLTKEFPIMDSSLSWLSGNWHQQEEKDLYMQASMLSRDIADSVSKITVLLSKPEFYLNDEVADYASAIHAKVDSMARVNDAAYGRLIAMKEQNQENQQNRINWLLHWLYAVILFTIILVVVVIIIASRYSVRKIVRPIVRLDATLNDLATGQVDQEISVTRHDEIGQMQMAVNKMIAGIKQKTEFAEQIGRGNYDAGFTLLSDEDKLGRALINMRDDLRRTHEALIAQDRRLLDAQRMARIGNYYYDFVTGELQTSGTLDDILGLDKASHRHLVSWRDHILPRFHDAVAAEAVGAIKERRKFTATYIVQRYNDRKECWVTATGEYNYDENGRAISMFGTIQDVNTSKQMEQELAKAYDIAQEQNNRLLNFSYIVSHNLRMHAVNIQGLLGMLTDATTNDEKRDMLSWLNKASARLDETLHHLNEVVAMQNRRDTKKTAVDLTAIVQQAITSLKSQITETGARIKNNVPGNVEVSYNAVYMESIVLNLLSNAIKYRHPDRDPVITISWYKNAAEGEWILEVADNGLGIDLAANGDKIFGMYKTFHGNEDARGVGLFMIKYQAEAMGGNITVESEVNAGSVFRVHIKQ